MSKNLNKSILLPVDEFVCVEVLRPSQPNGGHVERGQFT